MFNSDLMNLMGAPRIAYEADSGGAGGGSTVMTAGDTAEGDTGGTGATEGGDGGSGNNGDNGGAVNHGDWRDQLPDDLKSNELFKSMDGKTIGDFANSFVELKGKSDKFTPPAEDATNEQRAAWLKERSIEAGHVIPEDVKGYEIAKPEIPDGMYYNNEQVDAFLKTALENGVSKQTVQAIIKANDDAAIAQHNKDMKDAETAHVARVDAMKKEYGDEYKNVVENSYRAAKAFGGDEFKALLEKGTIHGIPLGDHPVIVATFNNVAKAIMEDKAGAVFSDGGMGIAPKNVDKQGNATLDFSKSMGSQE